MKKIKANELRIGNLIEVPMFNTDTNIFTEKITEDFGYVITRVNSFWISECEQKCDNWAGRPILLNEDWLIKLGFIKQADVMFFYKDELIELKNDGYIDYHSGVKLEYVHELQNAYFYLNGFDLPENNI